MRTVTVTCAGCGTVFRRYKGEVARSLRKGMRQFCSSSCGAITSNAPRCRKPLVVVCPCGAEVVTTTHNKATRHCSASCASKYHVTPLRREKEREAGKAHAGNLMDARATLISREGWKYEALEATLGDRPHKFEYPLGIYVYDLALLDTMTIVEFDGPYHDEWSQLQRDYLRDKAAEAHGFTVVRIKVGVGVAIPADALVGIRSAAA